MKGSKSGNRNQDMARLGILALLVLQNYPGVNAQSLRLRLMIGHVLFQNGKTSKRGGRWKNQYSQKP